MPGWNYETSLRGLNMFSPEAFVVPGTPWVAGFKPVGNGQAM